MNILWYMGAIRYARTKSLAIKVTQHALKKFDHEDIEYGRMLMKSLQRRMMNG